MASRNFFVVAPDPTSLPGGISAAQLQTMFQQLTTASDILLGLAQEVTPDTATYPEYTRILWLKPTTGEVKYWNGASWQLIFALASIADGSLGIAKLSTSGGSPLQLIQVNAGGTAFQFVNATDLITAGSVTLAKLAAVTQGDFLYARDGTTLQALNFEDAFTTALLFAQIPAANLVDLAVSGAANQVLALTAPGAGYAHYYVDALLRANKVAFDRLLYPAGSEGKIPVVNAGRTDVTFSAASDISGAKSAVVKYTGAAATVPQTVTTGSNVTVQFNAEVDPAGIVALAANQITLTTGSYLLQAKIPVFRAAGGSANVVAILRDITAATTLVTATGYTSGGGGDTMTVCLDHPLVIASPSNTYEIQLRVSADIDLGVVANLAGLAETYQQLTVLKTA